MMKDFIIYIVQSGICLSFFGIVYFLFLRKQTFFRFNRIFLLGGLLISFILPSIQFSYEVAIAAIPTLNIPIMVADSLNEEAVKPSINIWQILVTIYLLGIVILMLRNVYIFFNLYRLKQSGVVSSTKQYRLIDSKKIKTPFSVLNNVFINTSKLQDTEKGIILKHEISHIDQKHWIDLLCSECALLLQWFNPLVWYYIYLLKENHEYLADQAVLNDGESAVVYRAVLINQQFQGPVFSFANSLNYPNQQNRLNMMKKMKTSPWKKISVLAVLPLLGAFFALSAKPNYVVKQDKTTSSRESSQVLELGGVEEPVKDTVVVIGFKEKEKLHKKASIKLTTVGERPLLIVNGEVTNLKIEDIDSDLIESMEIYNTAESHKEYGAKGKNGVVKVTLKKEMEPLPQKSFIKDLTKMGFINNGKEPLLFLDGEEISKKELKELSPETISSISVIKDKTTVELHGERAKDGVITVVSRKAAMVEIPEGIQISFSVEGEKVVAKGVLTDSLEREYSIELTE